MPETKTSQQPEIKNSPTFTLSEVVTYGWTKALNNIVPFLKYMIIAFLVTLAVNQLKHVLHAVPGMDMVLGLADGFITAAIYYKVYLLALAVVDDKKDEINKFNLTGGYENFLNYLIASVVTSFIIIVGIVLLIVPGVLWAIKYFFTIWIVVDTKAEVGDALKKSGELTKNIKSQIFGLILFSIGVYIVGLIPFGLGILVTIPWILLTIAYTYRKLTKPTAVI